MPRRPDPPHVTSLHLVLVILAIAAIFVDDPARWDRDGVLLRHAEWDGVLPADLVTPIFLFFLGAAIPLSRRPISIRTLLAIAAGLCATGLLINGFWRADLTTWRVPGVLQRAGVALALAGTANAAAIGDHRRRTAILTSLAGLITLTHWLVMAHVAPPAGAPGDLSAAGNLAAWVDRVTLGRHAWNEQWDPDGILSTLASVSTMLAGIVAGIAIVSSPRPARTTVQMIGAGAGAGIAGLLWTFMVPINRSLWSASFVVFTDGVAVILLAAWSWSERRRRRERGFNHTEHRR